MSPRDPEGLDVLDAVRDRYAEGAEAVVPELCCPVDYDASLLKVLPEEIVERDYGCGDPSRFVRRGDVVLDLGSGAGKICYMASQLTGPEGRVIGVDTTAEMLALARRWQQEVGERIGHHNVEFRHGRIQDLRLDRDRLAAFVEAHPASDLEGLERVRAEEERLRREESMIADGSVDLVLSNCVLNLVDNRDKELLFDEIARVLASGGRCAISDIVSDEDVPLELQRDPELWSGCISGAMREDRFLEAFARAGLHGVEIAAYQAEPWAVVRGIEFRSMTVVAHKGAEGPSLDQGEAILYGGPWKQVVDDEGRVFVRGERTAVSHRTFERLQREPYASSVQPIPPLVPIREEDALPFDEAKSGSGSSGASCGKPSETRRDPRETKRGAVRPDVAPGTSDGAASKPSSCC